MTLRVLMLIIVLAGTVFGENCHIHSFKGSRISCLSPQSNTKRLFSQPFFVNKKYGKVSRFFAVLTLLGSLATGVHHTLGWKAPEIVYDNPENTKISLLGRLTSLNLKALASEGVFLDNLEISENYDQVQGKSPFGTRWNHKESKLLILKSLGITEMEFSRLEKNPVFKKKFLEAQEKIMAFYKDNNLFDKLSKADSEERFEILGHVLQMKSENLSRSELIQVEDILWLKGFSEKIMAYFPELSPHTTEVLSQMLSSLGSYNTLERKADGSVGYNDVLFDEVNNELIKFGFFIDFDDLRERFYVSSNGEGSPFFYFKAEPVIHVGDRSFLYLDVVPYGGERKSELGVHKPTHLSQTLRVFTSGIELAAIEQYAAIRGIKPLNEWGGGQDQSRSLAETNKSLKLYLKAQDENPLLKEYGHILQAQILLVSLHEYGHGKFGADELGANLFAMAMGKNPHMMLGNILRWYGLENARYDSLYERLESSVVSSLFDNIFEMSAQELSEKAKQAFIKLHPDGKDFFESGTSKELHQKIEKFGKIKAKQLLKSHQINGKYPPDYVKIHNRIIQQAS